MVIPAGQDPLQHHVVGEENVQRSRLDLLPLLRPLLARIPPERHRRLAQGIAVVEELPQLQHLAVRQGVHGVDDDGLDPLARAHPEHMVHDGDDVGEALPGAGTRSEDVVLPPGRRPYALHLVPVEAEGARVLLGPLLLPEDFQALGVEEAETPLPRSP